jgi:hypothetical protein
MEQRVPPPQRSQQRRLIAPHLFGHTGRGALRARAARNDAGKLVSNRASRSASGGVHARLLVGSAIASRSSLASRMAWAARVCISLARK